MAEIDPSKMALQIAGLRANETHLPENERVFQDPYAEYFFLMKRESYSRIHAM
jgi:O-methyltransferase involved in polyketide biosynthesis